MRLRFSAFLIIVAASFALCHLAVTAFLPASWHGGRGGPDKKNWFLAVYGDFGIDYYVMRFGLLGVGEHLKKANIICSSSSKGLFGDDADLLSKKLATPDHPVRVFNLSFGFGEGLGYLMECVKSLDLHDQSLILDLTDSTRNYQFSKMGELARKTTNWLDAYKIVFENHLIYSRDRLFQNRVPKISYSVGRGFLVTPQVTSARNIRCVCNGNLQERLAAHPHEPWIGNWTLAYCYDELRVPFFEECNRRNIRIIFTSIPTQDFDPAWGRQIAQRLGIPHVTVDPRGIELCDKNHMSTQGRQLFSSRLAAALLDNEETAAMIHGKEAMGTSASGRSLR
ncbi:MAG: hypothetical protein FJ271_29685 [Planctomycetes bacterium]|nr:hypothetical protein [Planctomycetota bacterium]